MVGFVGLHALVVEVLSRGHARGQFCGSLGEGSAQVGTYGEHVHETVEGGRELAEVASVVGVAVVESPLDEALEEEAPVVDFPTVERSVVLAKLDDALREERLDVEVSTVEAVANNALWVVSWLGVVVAAHEVHRGGVVGRVVMVETAGGTHEGVEALHEIVVGLTDVHDALCLLLGAHAAEPRTAVLDAEGGVKAALLVHFCTCSGEGGHNTACNTKTFFALHDGGDNFVASVVGATETSERAVVFGYPQMAVPVLGASESEAAGAVVGEMSPVFESLDATNSGGDLILGEAEAFNFKAIFLCHVVKRTATPLLR